MGGIDVIGLVSAHCGLSVAARTTLTILTGQRHEVGVVDVALSGGRSGQDHAFDHLLLPPDTPPPHDLRLFHLNPPMIGQVLDHTPALRKSGPVFNVAVPFWELPRLPDFWVRDLARMDMLLCPSRFIEQTMATTVMDPMPAIRHFPQTVFLPERHRPDRVRYGLPEQGFCFVMSFDLMSDMERKNPWGVIDAFNHAFDRDENVWLIVKVGAGLRNGAVEVLRERLQSIAATNDRIMIVDRNMPYDEVVSLYESCDVFVSLHRSEGLGLGLMEAMLLGKPVIATAWSGNMDFMTDADSCLVGYRLVSVRSPVYETLVGPAGSVWADPDPVDAVQWMRRLYEHPDLCTDIGTAAQEAMLRRQQECRAKDIVAVIEACRASVSLGAGISLTQTTQTPTVDSHDQAALFARVSAMLKHNDIAGAIALYERSRPHLCDTPELIRFDDVMRRLRQKASAMHP